MTLHCTCHRVALLLQMVARLFWSHYKTCAQIVMSKARWLTRDIDRCKTNRWYWTTSPTPTPGPWRSCGVLNSVDLRDVADKAPGEQQKGDKKRDRGSLMPIWTPWWYPPCWAVLLMAASSQWTSCPPCINKCNKWRHKNLFLDTSYEVIIGLFFSFSFNKKVVFLKSFENCTWDVISSACIWPIDKDSALGQHFNHERFVSSLVNNVYLQVLLHGKLHDISTYSLC